ncbi:MAG: protein-glutamate O-methyltransferase CheR [Alphaproteobacteria bacterium]
MSALSQADFSYVARELLARSGIVLPPEKAHLIETRASNIARREGFLSVQELITTARARRDERLISAIADTLINNETYFFRDRAPFEFFRKVMTAEITARRPDTRLRVWSAGCASGQEPYSLAILLEEMKTEGRLIDCEILATDISPRILEKARAGLYSQFEVQRGLPIQFLVRHFEKFGEQWRVSDRVRAKAKLQAHNILSDAGPLGKFDIVFCRNVLSSFDDGSRALALDRIAAVLADDGYLVLGQDETLAGTAHAFAQAGARAGIYTRVTSSARRAAA